MKRNSPDDLAQIESLFTFGNAAPGIDEKLRILRALREDTQFAAEVDRIMLERLSVQQLGLVEAGRVHKRLEAVLEKMSAMPWFPATFVAPVQLPSGPRALVQQGSMRRLVETADGVSLADLDVGAEVYLGRDLNVIMGRAPKETRRGGELCLFHRRTGKGQLVVKSRDEEVAVDAPAAVHALDLKPGDQLRWNRDLMIAFEKLERSRDSHLFLEETPSETFDQVGGLSGQVQQIQRSMFLHWKHAEVTRKYGLRRVGSILLCGSVGTGKTLMAKAVANWLAQFSPQGRSLFMNIKPGALHSMWYSQSEANYREVFRIAREAGEASPDVPVVLFFDEVDAIGGIRGQSHMRVHDNVLTAFLAELDGLAGRGNIMVVAATNRREALDPALLRPGRLGDLVLEVPRPNRQAARDIFLKHLPSEIPFGRNGHGDDLEATRQEIIESAVSRIYAPNGEGDLATIVFRDGKRRPVRAADLISGAVIANIVRAATQRACQREVETGESGVVMEDVAMAVAHEFETAARALNPANCRNHLPALPQDMDVVRVEPVVRKVSQPQRFLAAV